MPHLVRTFAIAEIAGKIDKRRISKEPESSQAKPLGLGMISGRMETSVKQIVGVFQLHPC